MQEAHCSYYGSLNEVTPSSTVGAFLVEDIYRKILNKHEAELIEDQRVLIDELKKSFAFEIRDFRLSVSRMETRMGKLEKIIQPMEKERDNAISKGKEGKKPQGIFNQCKKGNGGG